MEKSNKCLTVGRVINGIEEWSWLKFFDTLSKVYEPGYVYPLDADQRIGKSFYYFRGNELPKEVFYSVYYAMRARFEIYYNMEKVDESKTL